MAASRSTLGDLHETLAKKLVALLKNDEVPASLIKEVREFLKDNDIQADAGDGGSSIDDLKRKAAPFLTPVN